MTAELNLQWRVKMKAIGLMILASALLCGCGTTVGDRGLSGAGIGAGIGLIGGPPGVIVGGVVGAGVGMVSSRRTIDLGRPFWRG
jgi:osmotically inducible lipoprotein OsmB